jgi:hypothetical protein
MKQNAGLVPDGKEIVDQSFDMTKPGDEIMNAENRVSFLKTNTQQNGPWARSVRACREAAARFNQLTEQLIQRLVADVQDLLPENMVRQAVIEAEALAWSTPFPLLFLPVLAEEKVLTARQWARHQTEILERQRSR